MHKLRENGLVWNAVGDDIVVLDLAGSVYLQVNGTGRLLWEALAGGCSETDMAQLLHDRFDIGDEQARSDVQNFLADIGRRGLLIR